MEKSPENGQKDNAYWKQNNKIKIKPLNENFTQNIKIYPNAPPQINVRKCVKCIQTFVYQRSVLVVVSVPAPNKSQTTCSNCSSAIKYVFNGN